MRIHWLFVCICNYCAHNVVRTWGLVGMWKVEGGASRKKEPSDDFPISLNTKFCSIWCRLAVHSMSKYGSQFELTPYALPRLGVKVEEALGSKVVPILHGRDL